MPYVDATNAADPDPESRGLAGINPNALNPPITDHGGVQSFLAFVFALASADRGWWVGAAG
jgi:hypothetical protein